MTEPSKTEPIDQISKNFEKELPFCTFYILEVLLSRYSSADLAKYK
jgi:hypothetical protein